MLMGTHHVAYNMAEAARQGLAAGVDFDISDEPVYPGLVEQVKQGPVPESEVDRAVARVLAAKFRLGFSTIPMSIPSTPRRSTTARNTSKLALKRRARLWSC